jgi:lysozyme
VARKKQSKAIQYIIYVTIVASVTFTGFLAYLWWKSKQMEFVHYPEFGIPMPSEYEIHGIDVSKYQQMISWESVHDMQVKDIRLGFAFMKATEGVGNTDAFFKRNWKKSKEAGMVRGAYHFFIATKDGKKQAENFISKVNLQSGDLPPVLDIEQTFGVPAVQLRKEIKEWLDVIEQYYGVKPIIYTYVDFYEKNLNGYFDDYPLWVAHYLQPHQPRISREWTFWQHSESGHVNGIFSRVDFDVFSGDSMAFRSLLIP